MVLYLASRFRTYCSLATDKHTPLDLHSGLRRPATSVWYSEIASCCADMAYSLEQHIFLDIEFDRIVYSIVENKRSFQKMSNDTKGPKKDAIMARVEIFFNELGMLMRIVLLTLVHMCGTYRVKCWNLSANDPPQTFGFHSSYCSLGWYKMHVHGTLHAL